MNRSSNLIPALLVSIGIFALGLCVKAGFDNFSYKDRVVTVRGLAEREVPANKVTWPIVYKVMGNDLPSLNSRIKSTNTVILDFLKTNGISDSEISVNPGRLSDLESDYYGDNKPLYRYSIKQVIVVTSEQVEKVRQLIDRQSELLNKGIAIITNEYGNAIKYEYTQLNDVKPDMITEATKNAREAGDRFAADSDSHLGKIKTASQGQFSINDRDDYTPYIKKIRVVSTIVYYLED